MSWIVIGLLAVYVFLAFRIIIGAELGGHGVFNSKEDEDA